MSAALDLVVAAVDDTVPGVRSVRLVRPDGGALPGYTPGSHVVVTCGPPGSTANAYSLTGDSVAPRAYTISVLRLDAGRGGSRWVHALTTGDRVEVTPPRSAFPPVLAARRHLLVAGGIGVTPILSHLRSAVRWGRDVEGLYAHRPGAAAHLYTCGPAGFMDTVTLAARRLGWPDERIHVEHFGVDDLDPGEPFEAVLRASGRTVPVPSGTSLLDALEGAGLAVPNLCRQGVCGECRVPVAAGTPLHRDLVLTDAEKAAADTLLCCVSRAADDRLELDL